MATEAKRRGARRTPPPAPARDLYEQGREAGERLADVAVALGRVVRSGNTALRHNMKRRPYGTFAAVAGVGYVLGGGLSPAALRLLVAAGGRVAFEMALHRMTPESGSGGR
jgi:hypothetical protein